MRRDWDTRARNNPRIYINWPTVPDQEEAFFASGREDCARYVRPFLEKMRFDPRGKTACVELDAPRTRITVPWSWLADEPDAPPESASAP